MRASSGGDIWDDSTRRGPIDARGTKGLRAGNSCRTPGFILARGGSASTTHLQRETPKLDHSRDMRFQIGTGRTRSRLHLFDVRFCVH